MVFWESALRRIHVGKTQIWNQAGIRPAICDTLERCAQDLNPRARVLRSTDRRGIKLLGTPLCHPDFVARHLQSVVQEDRVLLQRIPRVKDLQSAWLLLCTARQLVPITCRWTPTVQANSLKPTTTDGVWQCACDILQIDAVQPDTVRNIAAPTGVGRSGPAERRAGAVLSVSGQLAGCVPTIDAHHPAVAESLVRELVDHHHTPCLRAAHDAAWSLRPGVEPTIVDCHSERRETRPPPTRGV